MRVTVLDLPGVIDPMQSTLHAAGVDAIVGDMNESFPEGSCDAIYSGNTSRIYGPRGHHELFAVNMLVTTAPGNPYAAGEYGAWPREAGYERVEFEPVPGRRTHPIVAGNTRPDPAEGTARA